MKKENKKTEVTGLHLLMPASQKGGASKTTTIAEVAAGLHSLGVKLVIANLEYSGQGSELNLHTMLRGSHIIDVDCDSMRTVVNDFGQIMQLAFDEKAVILLDVPAGILTRGVKIWETLLQSQHFEDIDSITLFGTVSNAIKQFADAADVTNSLEHNNKYIFYRGWSNPLLYPSLTEFPQWQQISDTYPSIVMPTLHDVMQDVTFGLGDYEDTPGLMLLKEWYKEEGAGLPFQLRRPVQHVIQAIDHMADFLKINYLPIISDCDSTD